MIRRWILALIVTVCASATFAQTVLVRSGEHDGFSRLVLDLPERLVWRRQPRESGVSIIFPGRIPAFDVTQVFDRLTQGRLSGLGAPDGQGTLDLTFGCECEAKVFWHSQSMLVVDIVDAPSAAVSRSDQERGDREAHKFVETMRPLATQSAPISVALAASQMFAGADLPVADIEPASLVPAIDLSTVRTTLLERVARSANQGLLQPVEGTERTGPSSVTSVMLIPNQQTDSAAGVDAGESIVLSQKILGINFKAQSSIDRELESSSLRTPEKIITAECLPDDVLDVAEWGRKTSFQDQIGALQANLSKEFDAFDAGVALQIARLYVYFGFGREARQVVMLAALADEEIQVLLELAAVVDDPETAPAVPRLRRNIGCHGASALWGALAHQAIPEDQVLDHDAILRGFAGLPDHLQRHLGPGLARKLLLAKHQDASDIILRSLNSFDLSETPGRNLVAAEMAVADGKFDAAEEALRASVDQNAMPSAEALMTLVDQLLSAGRAVPYDTAQLVGALFQEHRGSPLGERLGQSYLLALAASKSFSETFSEYDRVMTVLAPQIARETGHDILRLLLRDAEDFDFLRHVVSGPADMLQTLPVELALQVAQRIFNLGFADEARALLNSAKTDPPDPRYQLLAADIALVQGHPLLAEAEILDLATFETNELRARARTMLGDHVGALNYLVPLENEAAVQRAAWLAEDWQKLLLSHDPVKQKLAHVLMQAEPSYDQSILSRNRHLVDQSADIRGLLNDLLGNTQVSEFP